MTGSKIEKFRVWDSFGNYTIAEFKLIVRNRDDGSWRAVFVTPITFRLASMSDDGLRDLTGTSGYYGGPGREYERPGTVKRSKTRIAIFVNGGLDI